MTELTENQRALYLQVLRGIDRERLPAATLLLREDVAPADRAAVADLLAPGAGEAYR